MSTALASKTRAETNPRKVSKMMGVRHVYVLLAAIVASTLATAQAQVSGDCGGGKNGNRPSNNCAVNRPYSSYGDETYWDNCANPYYCYYNSAPKYGSTGPYGFSGWNPCSNVVGAYSQGQCRDCVGSFGSWGSCSSTQCGVYGTRTRKYTQTTTRSGRGAVECPYSHNHVESQSCYPGHCPPPPPSPPSPPPAQPDVHLYSQREEKPCDGDEYCCAETTWNKMGKFGFESGCSRTVRAERFVVNAEPKSVQHTSQPVVSSNVTGLREDSTYAVEVYAFQSGNETAATANVSFTADGATHQFASCDVSTVASDACAFRRCGTFGLTLAAGKTWVETTYVPSNAEDLVKECDCEFAGDDGANSGCFARTPDYETHSHDAHVDAVKHFVAGYKLVFVPKNWEADERESLRSRGARGWRLSRDEL